MKLKWYGHASFRITTNSGSSIITDPYDPNLAGYKPVTEPANVVVISSDNDLYHSNTQLIPGEHITINALELARSGKPRVEHGVTFTAVEAMEALDHAEHDPDQNGMYRMLVDGISIGHMGDIGNALTQSQLEFFAGIDVLLALTGGHPTLALDDLETAIQFIKPRLVIPMHFRTLTYKPRNTVWIESFLAYFDVVQVDFACSSEVELSPSMLPDQTRVLVIDYAH